MKKKILFSVAAFLFCFVTVNAATLNPKVKTTPATNVDVAPDTGTTVYAINDTNAFNDFAETVKFTSKSGNAMITPGTDNDAKKIIVSTNPAFSKAVKVIDANNTTLDTSITALDLKGNDGDWFTAYCLDHDAFYPQYSIYNLYGYPDAVNNLLQAKYGGTTPMYDKQVGVLAFLATLNNAKLLTALDKASALNHYMSTGVKFTFAFENGDGDISFSVLDLVSTPSAEFTTMPSATNLNLAGAELKKILGIGSARVIVKKIEFPVTATESVTLDTAKLIEADPSGKNLNGDYVIEFNAKDVLLDKYTVNDGRDTTAYNHSLWIIEHSYPSMTVDELLAEVGATKETLVTQLKGLYPSETFTDEEMNALIDNYVYETVQHAIWNVNGAKFGEDQLGSELHLGELGNSNVLNTIYQYLIKDRGEEYANYGKNTYNSKKIDFDKTNNDKVTEKGDYLIYGPYKATYNVIDPKPMTVEVTSGNADSVSFVDADGNQLTAIESGKEFYVRCKKSAKVTNVKFKITATGRTYEDNEKGKVYFANYPNQQNVLTGLKYKGVTQTDEVELTYNPKTGVPNIAIVFIITLIAFSLGYLALSYNNKSMELN